MSDAQQRGGVREDYRALTGPEREILEMLLSVEAPGIDELRAQVAYVEAARWRCGCASFDLRVDRERAPRSSITTSPAVEAVTKEREDVNGTFDLLLWVDDGWLSGVEIVDYVDRHGDECRTRSLHSMPGTHPCYAIGRRRSRLGERSGMTSDECYPERAYRSVACSW